VPTFSSGEKQITLPSIVDSGADFCTISMSIGKDVLGIIPGSMTAPGFIVSGKGEPASLNSASHGAGRQLSRTKAK